MIYSDIRSGKLYSIKDCLYSISRSSGLFCPIPTKESFNLQLPVEEFFFSLLDVFFEDQIHAESKSKIFEALESSIHGICLCSINNVSFADITTPKNSYKDYLVNFVYTILNHTTHNIRNILIYEDQEYLISTLKNSNKYKIIYISREPAHINYGNQQVLQINIPHADKLFYDHFFTNYRLFELTQTIPLNGLNLIVTIANIVLLFLIKKKIPNFDSLLLNKDQLDLIDAFMIAKKMGLNMACFLETGNVNTSSMHIGYFNSEENSFVLSERFFYIINNFSSDGINIMMRDVTKRKRIKINESYKTSLGSFFTKELNEVQENLIYDKKNALKGTAYETFDTARTLSLYELNTAHFGNRRILPLNLTRTSNVDMQPYDCEIKYLTDFSIENLNSEIYKSTNK